MSNWSAGHHISEGHSIVTHDDYGSVPAWNNDIAMAVVELLNKGRDADYETVRRVLDQLGVGSEKERI